MQFAPHFESIARRRLTSRSFPQGAAVPVFMLLDFLVVVAASYAARTCYETPQGAGAEDAAVGALVGVVFVLVNQIWGLYDIRALASPLTKLRGLLVSLALSIFLVISLFFFTKTGADHSRAVVAIFIVLAPLSVSTARTVAGRVLKNALASGAAVGPRMILLGEASELENFRNRSPDAEALARFGVAANSLGLTPEGRRQTASALEAARALHADEFALFLPWTEERLLRQILEILQSSPLPARLHLDRRTREIFALHRGARIDPNLTIEVQRAPLRWSELAAKRAFDIVVAALGLLFFAPLLLLTAVLIKADSAGPVIFKQRRIGFDNRAFTIFKFRSMLVCEDGAEIPQAQRSDQRVTKIGAILRRTSVDELPQLWNVLRGEMSIVGPRPHAMAHDRAFGGEIAKYARRHHVKPGLTGAAQARGLRGETPTLRTMEERVEWDLWYINNWSFGLDLRILFQTFASLVVHDSY